ncbi:FBXL3 [Mytilus coruscus]|uniref:FBXL3 n=1 Tax=Mytilus coruscus TaxID=42192 RepID=A0A6J8DVQ3_MYTCO|nr:FBXL3 [Mytilus coruscus]
MTKEFEMEENESQERLFLTDLPIELIIHILQFLPLSSKYRASMVCHSMYNVFNHPELWRQYELVIEGDKDAPMYSDYMAMLAKKAKLLISKFGKYFKILTINVHGHLKCISKDWHPVLLKLSNQCSLEKLILKVGTFSPGSERLRKNTPRPLKEDMISLLSLIRNSNRIKHLDIKCWPFLPEYPDDQDIIKVIVRNPTFHRLVHLSILWPDTREMLSIYQPHLPNRRMVLELVSHLKNLKSLELRSTMLSNDLLKEFAHCERVDKIQSMKIYVTHGKSNPQFHIPFINPSSWKRLTDINPNFSVNCWVIPRVPAAVLSNMLTFDCPLSRVVFLEWSRVNDLILESMTTKYSKTLKRFELYCGLKDYDNSLIRMVEECTLLKHLVIKSCTWYGLHYRTVMELAVSRGSGWKTFQIDEKNISFVDKSDHAETDEKVAHIENKLAGIAIEPENEDRKLNGTERVVISHTRFRVCLQTH